MSDHLEFHPLAMLWPLMSEAEAHALKESIRLNGVKLPIVLFEGKILDGRNRWLACQALGVEPPTEEWDRKGEPLDFVIAANDDRRHLSSGQRACVAVEIEALLAESAKERQRTHAGTAPGKGKSLPEKVPEVNGEARVQAAQRVCTNPHYVTDAKRLKRDAPELYEQVRSGKLSIKKAIEQFADVKPGMLDLPSESATDVPTPPDAGEADPGDDPGGETHETAQRVTTASSTPKATKGSRNFQYLDSILQVLSTGTGAFLKKCRPAGLCEHTRPPGPENRLAIRLSAEQRAILHDRVEMLRPHIELMLARLKPENPD